MSKTLRQVAEQLHASPKRVQLIYAFNGMGKTRLSREFKELVSPKNSVEGGEVDEEPLKTKILYYNAFTEDLFYWDNDLEEDVTRKLKIQPNAFTSLVLEELGQDQTVITHFQRYTDDKLTPEFNAEYLKNLNDPSSKVNAFSEVTFSFERGNATRESNIKISKGEESNFIWSVFYTILDQLVEILNVPEVADRETDKFNDLEYIFIDDPVSSLDENHLIKLAVDLAELIKSSQSNLKFIISTHNPLFFNVLFNEFNNANADVGWRPKHHGKYRLESAEGGTYNLVPQPSDSPFSYHLFLMSELERVIQTGDIRKYHFNFLRNILEKTSTFLGYGRWEDLLPTTSDGRPDSYAKRITNSGSHSKHPGDEISVITPQEKNNLMFVFSHIRNAGYGFKPVAVESTPQEEITPQAEIAP